MTHEALERFLMRFLALGSFVGFVATFLGFTISMLEDLVFAMLKPGSLV